MRSRKERWVMAGMALHILAAGLRADISLPRQAPPQVDALVMRVLRGGRTGIPLRAHYGGGETITFSIVQQPEHGRLSDLRILGDNRASVTYENDPEGKAISDGFRYVARTSSGHTSSSAEVRITIDEIPARMSLPERMQFDEIKVGESGSRSVAVSNKGGGVLEGRLSASAPWQVAEKEYRVKAGETEMIEVIFRPDEGRDFVGQLTFTGFDGSQNVVLLEGSASAPANAEDGRPNAPTKAEAAPAIEPPKTAAPAVTPSFPERTSSPRSALPSRPAIVSTLLPAASPPATPPEGASWVEIKAQRLDSSHWELRWPRPKINVSRYRIEERFLSLADGENLQTSWRPLGTPPEMSASGGSMIARVGGLDSKQLHMLRVTALGEDDGPLWESPPVALAPIATPNDRRGGWLLILGLGLVGLLVLRWRSRRAPA